MDERLRIIVTGLIGQHWTLGGVTWDYLQYVVGLCKLGHEVYYFEDSGEWPYNSGGGESGNDWVAESCESNVSHIKSVLNKYNLGDNWAYKFPLKQQWFGLSSQKRKEIIKTADLLLNISGTLEHPEHYKAASKMVYIDSDPGFTQINLRKAEFFQRVNLHDLQFSFGELLHDRKDVGGFFWHPTRSPIVLSEWDNETAGNHKFTTIMNWTSYEPLIHNGVVYGQKDTEFIKFIKLPKLYQQSTFKIALSELVHDDWNSNILNTEYGQLTRTPKKLMEKYGWEVIDANSVCSGPEAYRNFITNSFGEWSIAKGGYVVDQNGWFSCRSACYLAASRPVVVQNTGFDQLIPTGAGLFAFVTIEEAIDAINQVNAYPEFHRRKAREIAHEYFDSSKILNGIIEIASTTKTR
ncbi:glycosyltransferase [Pleomorphovibrio marinus]|uniref:glycosyltransferase n=1 Tax=Pleomorphovibrio marinus TaxID=2164132 RepID=UPI000E0B889F|nr:hypothetical protein [Pleomorphovibrio marinus]